MNSRFTKLFVLLPVLVLPILLLLTTKANAQTNGCDVIAVTTRTTREVGVTFFNNEANRPYFYIDIVTQNCMNESIEVSLTEDDAGVDDDVNGTLGLSETCISNNTCMDNRVINVTSTTTSNFTLALIVGEDECQSSGDPDCQYHVETFDEVDDFEWPQVLGFNCSGTCDLNWQYLGTLPYLGVHSSDPDGPNGGSGTTPGDGGASMIPDATGSSTVSEIELHLVNPISTSVNSIPEFFEKVIDIIIKIAIPFTAIVLVYCGLLFVTARGDTAQIEKARHAFTYAVIGGLVLLSSWLIAAAIRDALTSITYLL